MPDAESPIPKFPLERQRALARASYALLSLAVLIPPAAWYADARMRGTPYDPGRWANYVLQDASGARRGTVFYRAEAAPDGAARVTAAEGADGGGAREESFAAGRKDGALAGRPGDKLPFFAPSPVPLAALLGLAKPAEEETARLAARFLGPGAGAGPPLLWVADGFGGAARIHRHARYGPRLAFARVGVDASGNFVGTALHDAATGLLLELRTAGPEGPRTLALYATNVPVGRFGAYLFGGLAAFLSAWPAAHLLRMRRAGLLDAVDGRSAARLYVRVLAFPFLDLGTALALPATGLCFLFPIPERATLAVDLAGFALLLYAIGPYALLVLPKFAGYLPGVAYPYYVPFFGFAVLVYLLVKYARRVTRSVLWPL